MTKTLTTTRAIAKHSPKKTSISEPVVYGELEQILGYLEHSSRLFDDAINNFGHATARLELLIKGMAKK